MNKYIEKNKKTRQLIQSAFLSILESKPFEAITIKDITEQAEINRGTFYLHYLDKFDLLDQMEAQLFQDLGKHIDELQQRYLPAPSFKKEQEQLAETLFSFIQLHAATLRTFLSDHGRAGFPMRFKHAFSENVRANLEKHEEFYSNLNVPMEYFLSFIISAFLGLIEQWIENDLDKTPSEMTALYIDIILFIQNK